MSWHNKVVWSEGMFLRPQHFQQHDRYLENLIAARLQGVEGYSWGIQELEIDPTLLPLGKVAVSKCRGVLPDGTLVSIPADDDAPAPLQVPANIHGEIVYLALPVRRMGAVEADSRDSDAGMARYVPREEDVRDNNAGEDNASRVQVGKLRLRLMLDSDDRSDYACLKLGRIAESRADGAVTLDEAFLPPCLDCQAVPRLAAFMTELQGLLHHRGESLAGRMTDGGKGVAEISAFMLLQMVNRLEPLVTHLSRTRGLHPEDLYMLCLQMAGELATFTHPDKRPDEITGYNHDDLQACFDPLMRALRQSLSMVPEQTATSLELQDRKYGVRVSPIADRSLLDHATFVLAVNADVAAEVLRSRFPGQIKIGPVEQIRQLVNLQLPGIELRPLSVAPRQIPYHAGFTYFELDRSSEYWQQLQNSAGFAMQVAGDFPGLQLEFWAIRG